MLSLVFTTSAVTPEQRVAFLQSSEYDYASPYTALGGAPSQLLGQPQDMGYGARPAPPSFGGPASWSGAASFNQPQPPASAFGAAPWDTRSAGGLPMAEQAAAQPMLPGYMPPMQMQQTLSLIHI